MRHFRAICVATMVAAIWPTSPAAPEPFAAARSPEVGVGLVLGRGDVIRSASPVVPAALGSLCYYAGVTYSPGAVIGTVLPSPASLPLDPRLVEDRRIIECLWSGEPDVPAFWRPLDPQVR